MAGKYSGYTFSVVFKDHNSESKRLRDFLNTGNGNYFFLIADRIRDVFDEHGLTGWKTYPVEVCDKKGAPVLGYHGFSILGKCGPITYDPATLFYEQNFSNGPLIPYSAPKICVYALI